MTPTRYRYRRNAGQRRTVAIVTAIVLSLDAVLGLAVALLAGRL